MQKIFVLGGDKRQIYLKELLQAQGFPTYSFGQSKAETKLSLQNALRAECVPPLVLPFPVTRDKSTLFMPDAAYTLKIEELFALLPPQTKVLGFCLPSCVQLAAKQADCTLVDLADEDFTNRNAALTAQALLSVLRERYKESLQTKKVLLLGFGHIGRAAAKAFSRQTAAVTVAARRAGVRQEIKKLGLRAVPFSQIAQEIGAADIVLNTVPAAVLGADAIRSSRADVLLTELASKPYGIDFDTAKQMGREVWLAAGLPGKYRPHGAAEILAEKVIHAL